MGVFSKLASVKDAHGATVLTMTGRSYRVRGATATRPEGQ